MAVTNVNTPGEEIDVGGTEVEVRGTATGAERVNVTRGNIELDASFNQGGDTITLPGRADEYQVSRDGSRLILTRDVDGDGNIDLGDNDVSISIPLGPNTLTLVFRGDESTTSDDDVRTVEVDGSDVVVGDQVVEEGDFLEGGEGAVVTLTSGPDNVEGTIFLAPRGFTPGGTDQVNTINDDDILQGVGDAVLRATLVNDADTGDNDIQPTLRDIPTVEVDARFDGSFTLDLQDADSVRNITLRGLDDNATMTFDNIQPPADGLGGPFNLAIIDSNADRGTVNFLFDDETVEGDADVVNLLLSRADVMSIVIDDVDSAGNRGIEQLNVTVEGRNEVESLTVEDVEAIDIDGTGDLTLGSRGDIFRPTTLGGTTPTNQVEAFRYGGGLSLTDGSLTLVDASDLEGDLDISLGSEVTATADQTSGMLVDFVVRGGDGNDTFRLLAGFDSDDDTIEGGGGFNTVQVFNDVTAGTFSDIDLIDVRYQSLGDTTITVDGSLFGGAEEIWLRNEGNQPAAGGPTTPAFADDDGDGIINFLDPDWYATGTGNFVSNNDPVVFDLNNLSAAQAQNIRLQHGVTGNNGLTDMIVDVDVAGTAGSGANTLVVVEWQDQLDDEDRGINFDPRFNFTLRASEAENVTLEDMDSEDNTVDIETFSSVTGTLRLVGGVAGDFLNLDIGDFGGAAPAGEGLYDLDASGSFTTADESVPPTGRDANILDNGGSAANRFTSSVIDATAHVGNIVVRVSDSAGAVGGQTIRMGSGDDTVIFDQVSATGNETTAGLTISDVVDGGDGDDGLVIDGHGVRIVISASEWTNVSNFEYIRLVGNGQSDNNGFNQLNAYNLTLTNDLIARNGSDVAGGRRIDIINDNDLTDGPGDAGTGFGFANTGVTIDARTLNAQSNFSYDGAEGPAMTADRFIMSDANINGLAVIDGGAAFGAGYAPTNLANDDVLEVRNAAVVTIGDLANIRNVGELHFTNDTAAVQSSVLQLSTAVIEALVNSFFDATAANPEVLTIRVSGNPLLPAAQTVLTIDASAVDFSQTQIVVILEAGGVVNFTANTPGGVTVQGSAGNDTITGTPGNDTINGNDGDDTINGGAGADTIDGGNGNDTINGGPGGDTLTGGAGIDTFVFTTGQSFASNAGGNQFDYITDFVSGVDRIDVATAPTQSYDYGSPGTLAQLVDSLETLNGTSNGTGAGGTLGVIFWQTTDGFTAVMIDSDNDGLYDSTNGQDVFFVLDTADVGNTIPLTDFI